MPDKTNTAPKNADTTTGDEPESFFAQGGFLQGLGLRRSLFEEDRARFELAVEPRHMNRLGIPHGGVYATILDSALGAAGCWDGAPDRFRPSVTLNLNVSYLAQPKGSRLIAEGRRGPAAASRSISLKARSATRPAFSSQPRPARSRSSGRAHEGSPATSWAFMILPLALSGISATTVTICGRL